MAEITPLRAMGGPLAYPKLQKVVVEQADPLGVSIGCHGLPPSSVSACRYFQGKLHFVILVESPTLHGKEALEIGLCLSVCLFPHHPHAILSKLAA